MNFNSEVLLSIRLMTYNHKDYIQDALQGIDSQITNFKFEVVIGDDFSTDNTLTIIKAFQFKNPNVKCNILDRQKGGDYDLERQKKGRLYNFVDTINNCKGKYIALLDGDDYWTDPLKLQKQVGFLESNSNYVACFHPCHVLKENETPIPLSKQNLSDIKYNYTFENLLSFWNIPTAAIIVRNDFKLPDWFTKVASGDIALLMINFQKGKLKILEDYMSVYRLTGKGVSETHKKYRMVHYRAILYTFLNEYFNYQYEKEIYNALFNIYIKYTNTQIPYKKNQSLRKNIISRILRK